MHLDWINLRHRIEYALFCCAAGLFSALPVETSSTLSGKMWRLVAPLLRRHRRALAHLRRAFPEKTEAERERIARDMWENLGRVFAEAFPSAGIRRQRADRHRGRGRSARHGRPHQGGRRLRRPSGQLGTRLDRSPAAEPQADRRLSENHQSLCRPACPGDAAGLPIPAASIRNAPRRRSSSCAMHAPAGPSPSSPTCAKETA